MRPREDWPVVGDRAAPGWRYDWEALACRLADAGIVDRARVACMAELLKEAHDEGYGRSTGYSNELLWGGDRKYEPGFGF